MENTQAARLDGKVALVTGGASGIGLATAELLAARGVRSAIVDIDAQRASTAAERLGGVAVPADVGDAHALDTAFAQAAERLGAIDLVVLSAGVSLSSGPLTAVSDEVFRKMMRVNVDGAVFGVRAALRALGERGASVVVLASLGGLTPIPTDPIYALTKHAVVGLVRSMPASKVQVNAVCPGMVDTPLLDPKTRRYLQAVRYPFIPIADVAELVVRVATGEGHGQVWGLQPGIEPWVQPPPELPGPRIETWGVGRKAAPSGA